MKKGKLVCIFVETLPRVSSPSTSELLLLQLVHMIVSYGAWYLFKSEKLDLSQDFLGCFRRDQNGEVVNAASRLMSQDTYQMEDMKIPRPKVRY